MIDFDAFADEMAKLSALYHGSRKKLTILKPGSYVTPHKGDAASFAVPWSSGELVDAGGKGGRPPKKLKFKGTPPKDHPIHIYQVTGKVQKAATNTGAQYDWNRTTVGKSKLKLVKTIRSWQKELLKEGSRLRKAVKVVRSIKPSGDVRQYSLDLHGEMVGKMKVVLRDDGNWRVAESAIDPKYRGLGLGKKLYGETMKDLPGRKLQSDQNVSDTAARVWEGMSKRKGYEVKKTKGLQRTSFSQPRLSDAEAPRSTTGSSTGTTAPVFEGRLNIPNA